MGQRISSTVQGMVDRGNQFHGDDRVIMIRYQKKVKVVVGGNRER